MSLYLTTLKQGFMGEQLFHIKNNARAYNEPHAYKGNWVIVIGTCYFKEIRQIRKKNYKLTTFEYKYARANSCLRFFTFTHNKTCFYDNTFLFLRKQD